eukprot:402918_1
MRGQYLTRIGGILVQNSADICNSEPSSNLLSHSICLCIMARNRRFGIPRTRFQITTPIQMKANTWNNPRCGDLEAQMYDGDCHQSIYKIEIDESLVRKIITGQSNHKIKLGTFKIKYPGTKRLFDWELSIQPNTRFKTSPTTYCDFALHLNCKRYQTSVAKVITINFIVYCTDIGIDTWRTTSVTKNKKPDKRDRLCHDSFQMKRFKNWYSKSQIKNERKTLTFCLMIKNLQLIDGKYHKNAKLITLSNFDYNQRYYRFTWNIDKEQIKKFKKYRIHQWHRSPIQFDKWYLVLYPQSDTEIPWAKPGYVQMALDLVTVPKSMYGVNVYFNAVVMETFSHFTNTKCLFQSEKRCMSQAANSTSLKTEELLTLDTITIEIEIYVFRPLRFENNVSYNEMFVTYWDRNSELTQIEKHPPNPSDMKRVFEWEIRNDERNGFNQFDRFVHALHGERFMSHVFEMGHLKWCLIVYPNGQHENEHGFVKLQLFFADTMPTNLSLIVIKYLFYCPEFNVYQGGLMQFEHREDEDIIFLTPQWQIGALHIDDVIHTKDKQITFGIDGEVVRVKNIQNDMIYERHFPFEFDTQIVMRLSADNWFNDLFEYKDTVWNNMWYVGYIPKENQMHKKEGAIHLALYSMPVGIARLCIAYRYSFMGIVLEEEDKWIDYDQSGGSFVWFKDVFALLPTARTNGAQFDLVIKIKIIALQDMNGNVMKPSTHSSNELYRLCMYLWKHQQQYRDALYYLRKCYTIFNQMNDESNCIMNRKLYLKQKRRLKRQIFKLNSMKMVASRYIAHCGNCNEYAVDGQKYKLCKGCRSVFYCGKSCQKRHWNAFHRFDCVCKGFSCS